MTDSEDLKVGARVTYRDGSKGSIIRLTGAEPFPVVSKPDVGEGLHGHTRIGKWNLYSSHEKDIVCIQRLKGTL